MLATEEYSTWPFHSHVSLGNPHKERRIKRICTSEPFLKPTLSLKKKPGNDPYQRDFLVEESKKLLRELATVLCRVFQVQEHQREEKSIVLLDLHKLRKTGQLSITDGNITNLPQKKHPELPSIKPWVGSEQVSEIAAGVQFPKKEWEIITRPSAKVKVILDPNTANPTLKLSADGRSVRTKTYKEFHSSRSFHEYHRKCQHQYNSWTCVQAQEGYRTGRHYWEVDVKGKCDWRIGVVKESAPRSGFINLNTAAGYWTLRLQLGSLIALTEPATKLNQAPLSKIGVYLDVEKGQVSFYDAMKRKHIYTFNTDFSEGENIYPVFGTVETDRPLKII